MNEMNESCAGSYHVASGHGLLQHIGTAALAELDQTPSADAARDF